ncbi:MAG: sigma-54-dependent Fis family transcriptional regulator [Porticoccus sp.]|jgi:two-component system response regulator FlrC|uniref:sigma-54-dependent transcriptional regulator n=1 Tax=Porticoccus sp. TaxID=2024853 RepID=UPI000C6B550D|nr:sigma-54 dependent transcriptional regulator [Porticoccus sp.]MAZ70636.1 sigma-54-dependent Fis family transcriptional regulator [Porticoccus sp.]MBG56721.1 sigma-54-dependent Fis family transcriptional regulator [Porticoccus sp.]|tara:strand:+ start:20291 stop:21631 length:1341 start_codon:yes stop_codon:yes gene_type:complete
MSNSTRVLVVEDDAALRDAMCDTIQYAGYRVLSASNGEEALWCLKRERVDLIVSDVQMDVMDGNTLLREAKALRPELPFVLVTAYGSIENAVKAMQEGAADYLLKPFEAEVLLEMVSRLARPPEVASDGMVAEDPKTRQLCELARRVAATQATVLISGESGTGKEVIARYIHRHSPRAEKPFLAINCAAIPETMLESMLFGYEKGAYTGAHQSRAGKFEQANGGTLLLDEVSEMDLGLQAKLLRVLQEKEVERLGGNTLISLDVRVLATTNRNLREEVASGRFREDLFYRLNVFPIHLLPLRQRPGDILRLAKTMLRRYSPDQPISFTASAEQRLLKHCWNGNVRELENCVQRAAIMASGCQIAEADICFEDVLPEDLCQKAAASNGAQLLDGDLKAREKQLIVDALNAVNGCRKDAAERLGISPRTLRYKLARLKEQGVAIPATG